MAKIKPQKRSVLGRPPSKDHEVNVVSKTRCASGLGFNLVVECIDRAKRRTSWDVVTDDDGKIIATILNQDRDVLTRHIRAVRRSIRRLARAAANQTEMFDPSRLNGGTNGH